MEQDYTLVENLAELIEMVNQDSIISRTFHKDETMRAILFGFDAGQELSEHSTPYAATLHIISGEATVTLGDDTHELGEGAWVAMPPNLKHGIIARTPVRMLLVMVGTG